MDFLYRSAIELASLIRDGKATSTEIVTAHLEQIKKYNSSINAVVILFEEEALATAAACDAEAREGKFRGPLHGVPMTVKEQYWVKGAKGTLNFKMLKDWIAPEDAVVVERLRHAGAVLLGKTNVPKNLTDYQVNGDIYPEGKNPYNTEKSPGGSSGGAAAALVSGMVPIELGGDFGGSIRNPSNFCGIYGMKPTENSVPGHGAVPKPDNERGFTFHMAQAGPMARTPEDLELIWKIIRGPHKSDRNTAPIQWKNAEGKALQDYRIAWVDRWPDYDTGFETKQMIHRFVEQLSKRNATLCNAGPVNGLHTRSLSLFVRLFAQLISQDVPPVIKPFMKAQLKNGLLKESTTYNHELNLGFKDSFIGYSETMGIRAGIVSEWEEFFENFDLLVCPAGFGPAFDRSAIGKHIHAEGKEMIYIDYCWPFLACFNGSGHPGITIPLGLNSDGLPIGVQVVGPYWSEPDLVQFAKLVSTFTEGFVKPEGY